MLAVLCEETGAIEGLRLAEREDPEPGPGQVVIAVDAAGVNYVDALFVQGRYQIRPPVPFVPGSEVAGRIHAVGEGVAHDRLGERVLAMCGLGGFAELVVVPADAAVPIPPALSPTAAAAFTQSYCTAGYALVERAALQSGERVLVLGGGGGVGLAVVDVAKQLGAEVIAAASTEEKRSAATAAGADAVIDMSGDPVEAAERLKAEARAWAGGAGIDVAVDTIGGPAAESALRALGYRGRLLVVGFASGEIPALPANQVLLRNRSVLGIDWGAWALSHPDEERALLQRMLAQVDSGALRPAEPGTRRLDQAVGALSDLLQRRVTGKLVLTP